MIIGCDFHPGFQQIANVDQETGEYGERRLNHREEAVRFYGSLAGSKVVVGMEATGNDRWFRKLLSEAGHELLVGDASAIDASAPREQRTDKRDARHILRLLVENRFPAVWQPSAGNEEQRQLLMHRCRLVRMRTRIKNQLDSMARSEGLTGSRADRRELGTIPAGQAGGQLSWADSVGGLQRQAPTADGPHYQAGQHAAWLAAGGGGDYGPTA